MRNDNPGTPWQDIKWNTHTQTQASKLVVTHCTQKHIQKKMILSQTGQKWIHQGKDDFPSAYTGMQNIRLIACTVQNNHIKKGCLSLYHLLVGHRTEEWERKDWVSRYAVVCGFMFWYVQCGLRMFRHLKSTENTSYDISDITQS